LLLTPEQSGTLLLNPAPSYGGFIMISFLDRMARAETEADREQFVRGVLGLDKFHAGAMVAGWMAGSLVTKIIPGRK
jgi:hypothetical protein